MDRVADRLSACFPVRALGAIIVLAILAGCGAGQPSLSSASPTTRTPGSPSSSAGGTSPASPPAAIVYLHYYTWWTPTHWQQKLGAGYPYAAQPPVLPGTVDATGCSPAVSYPGATIVDVPSEGLYDQGQAATLDRHIAAAAAAGVTGFLVSWQGVGSARQTPASSGYDSRLQLLVERVDAYNATHSVPFRLGLAFASFGNYTRPPDQIIGDLTYFSDRYAHDPAFANAFSARPLVMWLDSRKAPLATVQAVSAAVRGSLYLIGDETYQSWARDAPYLDATSYYWSSQDPYQNPASGQQILSLASQVRADGGKWFAPFTAGYDKILVGGGCVPRNGVETLDRLWQMNGASHPDAWFGISWNEFVENTYLEPTVRYGATYLDELRRLILAASG